MNIGGIEGVLASFNGQGDGSDTADIQNQEKIGVFANILVGKIFDMFDKNGDGALSADELGLPEQIFKNLDVDGDGVVTQEELAPHLEKVMGGITNMGGVFEAMNRMPPPDQLAELLR